MIRNVRIALFTVLLAIICCGTVNAYSWSPSGIIADTTGKAAFDVGPWEGEARFSTGWSEWSTEVPKNATKYAKATIYVSAINWAYPDYTVDDWRRPAHNTVCGPDNSSCRVVNQYKTEYNVCTRWDTHYNCNRTSGHGGCGGNECGSCEIDYNNRTGTCTGTYKGQFQWCANAYPCGGNMKPCYWLWNGKETSYTECGASENRYYWSETYTFANPSDKSNWRKSLSEAGGFAKQVYIYSYPQRVYINYNSMGADGLCTAWNKSSNNDYNANENIHYVEGNPVCNSKTTGYMPQSYVNYYQNDTSDSGRKYNLSENQYMKTGYDFKGWVLDRSCLNADGTLAKTCDIYDDKQTITNTPGNPPSGLKANAGDTVTLYAVWQKHDYKITFQYWCGQNPNTKTYHYQAGLTLKNIEVNSAGTGELACNTDGRSDTNGGKAKTYFDGWYEKYDPNTGTYSSKISAIPGNYWRDITLYGRMHQIRTFDYSRNKWIWQ